MDRVINVVTNADISKNTQNHIFFQLYQKYQFFHPETLQPKKEFKKKYNLSLLRKYLT